MVGVVVGVDATNAVLVGLPLVGLATGLGVIGVARASIVSATFVATVLISGAADWANRSGILQPAKMKRSKERRIENFFMIMRFLFILRRKFIIKLYLDGKC